MRRERDVFHEYEAHNCATPDAPGLDGRGDLVRRVRTARQCWELSRRLGHAERATRRTVAEFGDMSDKKTNKGSGGVKLFCSYCRADEKHRMRFSKQIALLKEKGLVSEWHDRMIPAGDDWQATIDENMDQADVVVLFLSPDFIASENCRKEAEYALRLRNEREATVIPVVLRTCAWHDWTELAKLQALPEDGKPVLNAPNKDKAWQAVYSGIKEAVNARVQKTRMVCEEFWKKMTSVGTLVAGDGAGILLRDVFVYPSLKDHTPNSDKVFALDKVSSDVFTRLDAERRKFSLILGDDQSGKTALCQMLFTAHWESGRIPVYADGDDIKNDNVEAMVRNHISRQYRHGKILSHAPNSRKVLIVDNFHKCALLRPSDKRDRLLKKFVDAGFSMVVLVGDSMVADLQTYEWKAAEEECGIERHSIMPLGYKDRATVIKKWANISGQSGGDFQHMLDRYEQPVSSMVAENYIPDYPFFVQSILQLMFGAGTNNHVGTDSVETPASVGHCYKALIVHALTVKGGINREKTGTYLNILTELAYYLYKGKEQFGKFSTQNFDAFFSSYSEEFNVAFSAEKARETLVKSGLLSENLYDLSFQEYVFYYFVARHLANRLDKDRESAEAEIATLCKNAHRKKCSGVVIFLIHHKPQSSFLIEELKKNLEDLFSSVRPTTLVPEETRFFVNYIRDLPLPQIEKIHSTESPESRDIASEEKREGHDLQVQHQEKIAQRAEELEDQGNPNRELADLTKSLRMLSIMGQILKNQEGEMSNDTLVNLSVDTQQMAFRILSKLYGDMEEDPEFWLEFVEKVFLKKHFSDTAHLTEMEKRGKAEMAFGMLAFQSALGIIDRVANAVGSDQLLKIAKRAAEQINTPAAHLVNFSIQGWYGKRLDIDEIKRYAKQWKSENPIALHILAEVVQTYFHMHKVDRATQGKLGKDVSISHEAQKVLVYKRSKEKAYRK